MVVVLPTPPLSATTAIRWQPATGAPIRAASFWRFRSAGPGAGRTRPPLTW